MKRRGFLAALAALPFTPFAAQKTSAKGGYHPGGMYLVGSNGPELEATCGMIQTQTGGVLASAGTLVCGAETETTPANELGVIRAELSEMRRSVSRLHPAALR